MRVVGNQYMPLWLVIPFQVAVIAALMAASGAALFYGIPAAKPISTEYCLVVCQVNDDRLTRLITDGWQVMNLGTATAAGIPVLLRRTK